ncbi:mRNA interferase MazF [Chryseobacterium ginsenosidimutans]|uniref:type II toxin-antitoxin system PemK/MazF family toxin n=1 Tax=Chryseobacterium ginsenosidimutans TaxID=687846 RepID=UPI002781F993|nr:type II toxin-antitoxin system PemK/MazF family toxin [Chryseobacterium ginsenosidimutans]MDQ0592178.1 mRNA interferase MazF [Chryseobacterium ginsenosidimutans]
MKTKQIWWINFNPSTGAEITKSRPAVIVSDDSIGILPLRVVVPITDWKERYNNADWMVKLIPDSNNGLTKESVADCFQVKSLSTDRFGDIIGILDDGNFDKVKNSLKNVFDL